MGSSSISCVVPTLNSAETLETTLLSLKSQRDASVEITVADSGSDDGTLEICQSGVEALLVPPANSGELAKALSELCSNAALREKLSSNGRRNVEVNFTMPRMLAQYEQAYEDVLSI